MMLLVLVPRSLPKKSLSETDINKNLNTHLLLANKDITK